MTFRNEYPYSKVNSSAFPYSHYFHHVRSESSPTDLRSDSEDSKKELVHGYMNKNVGNGQGIKINIGGEVGGKHGIGIDAGGNVASDGAGLHAGGHVGTPSYGIHAKGSTLLNSSQGLELNAKGQALGKYGLAAEGKTHIGGDQGTGFHKIGRAHV